MLFSKIGGWPSGNLPARLSTNDAPFLPLASSSSILFRASLSGDQTSFGAEETLVLVIRLDAGQKHRKFEVTAKIVSY